MTASELWGKFAAQQGLKDCPFEAWSFGENADLLAGLVADGTKTATSSAYPLYQLDGEPLPCEGQYSVILNSRDEAVCIIRTKKVCTVPFDKVSAEHAAREGEGDRSLTYWRQVHRKFFAACLEEYALAFDETMGVVCEEFEVVFRASPSLPGSLLPADCCV